MPRHSQEIERKKDLIAQECARIIHAEGIRDFALAKRKAARRLNISGGSALPDNQAIENALRQHQELFFPLEHHEVIASMRQAAIAAMQTLEEFRPRLAGSVLSGTAVAQTPIWLHLFAETAEAVEVKLIGMEIPFKRIEKRVQLSRNEFIDLPGFSISDGATEFELSVFSLVQERSSPISPVTGNPMGRAKLKALKSIVENSHKER